MLTDLIETLRQICSYVPGIANITGASYLFRPFLMLVALGIIAGLVGVLINLRCLEFNAEATVHSVFPGIVVGALYYGIDGIIPGAAIVAVLVAIALTLVSHNESKVSEAGTAVVLTSFFSLGIIISLYKGDKSGQLEALMFGRLLEVTEVKLWQSLGVCLIALIILALCWKEQVFLAFDRTGAMAAGLPVFLLDFLVNAAIAAVVVAAASAVGVLLVIGYLVVPGATARLLARSTRQMVAVAVVVGIFSGYLGMQVMLIPWSHPMSPQAAVALSTLAMFMIVYLGQKFAQMWRKVGKKPRLAAAGVNGSIEATEPIGADGAKSTLPSEKAGC